jgi:mitochondrial import inner membrane translocase subunit TIM9
MSSLVPSIPDSKYPRLTIRQAFGGLVEHCFTSCVDDFTSKSLSTKETGCLNRCVLKWMATQQRVSDRFQEHNQQISQQMAGK